MTSHTYRHLKHMLPCYNLSGDSLVLVAEDDTLIKPDEGRLIELSKRFGGGMGSNDFGSKRAEWKVSRKKKMTSNSWAVLKGSLQRNLLHQVWGEARKQRPTYPLLSI